MTNLDHVPGANESLICNPDSQHQAQDRLTNTAAQSDVPEAHSDMPEAQSDVPEAQSDVPEAQTDMPEAQSDVPEAQKTC